MQEVLDLRGSVRGIRFGTSSFSHEGWRGVFYSDDAEPKEFIRQYAERLDVVEVDSTFYRSPSESMVRSWAARTPDDFTFCAKVPRSITHEKLLVDCDREVDEFLAVMSILGGKLGPLLFQFGYMNKKTMPSLQAFLDRLDPFLERIDGKFRFAVEVRNRWWLTKPLLDCLRRHAVALAIVDQSWMPAPAEWLKIPDVITASFAYVRLIGDRKATEERTKTWDKPVLDRSDRLREWVPVVRKLREATVGPVLVFANNHFAGHAPATLRELAEMLKEGAGLARRGAMSVVVPDS